MPVTMKTGVIKYKSPTTGEYIDIDAIGSSSGAIIDDTAGEGDTTVTWSADKLSGIDEDVSDLKNEIDDKQDAPATAGTAGQVLSLDNNLDPVWGTIFSSEDFTRHLPPNSDDAVTMIGETALTYINYASDFTYGGHYSATREDVHQVDGKWEINCSTFAMLLIFGVTYANSTYQRGVALGNVKNRYACTDEELWDYYCSVDETKSGDYRYKYAYNMAEWMYNKGYCFKANSDFSNIRAGDVLFMKNQTGSEMSGQFMDVDHVCVFGYWNSNRAYTVWEVGTVPSEQMYLISNLEDNCVLVARLPYSGMATEIADIGDFKEPVQSTDAVLKYLRIASGNFDIRKYYTFIGRIYYPESVFDFYPVIYNGNTRLTGYDNASRKPDNSIFVMPFSVKTDNYAMNLRINRRNPSDSQPNALLEWYCIVEGIHLNPKQLRHVGYLQNDLNDLSDKVQDETEIISVDVEDVISTTHTLNTSQCHVEKRGNLLLLNISVTLTADIAAFGKIAEIASGYIPIGQVWGYCATGPYDVTTSGNIRALGSISSGRTVQATIIYAIAT